MNFTSRRLRSSSRRRAISCFCRCLSSIGASWDGFIDDDDREFCRLDGGDGDASDKVDVEF